MLKIGSLEKLIHELNRLPGIGPKTAQRLAYYILRRPEFSEQLQAALHQVVTSVHPCTQCFSYTDDGDLCRFCTDTHRKDDVICIVEEPSDIARVESSGVFRGRYHVLHGAISPLDNIAPQDLKINELVARIEAGLEDRGPKVSEVILALDPDLEGDTTVLYLAKILADKDVTVTRIASG